MRRINKRKETTTKGTVLLTGCGGPGDTQERSALVAHGIINQANPYIGYIEFLSTGACRQNGYYVTIEIREDAHGNLTGTVNGRFVSPSEPLTLGHDKYQGPLNAQMTGKQENGQVTFVLSGDIQGTCGGALITSSGFAKIIGNENR